MLFPLFTFVFAVVLVVGWAAQLFRCSRLLGRTSAGPFHGRSRRRASASWPLANGVVGLAL
eukprot:1073565-Pyramimonas_sp.AAC.1